MGGRIADAKNESDVYDKVGDWDAITYLFTVFFINIFLDHNPLLV